MNDDDFTKMSRCIHTYIFFLLAVHGMEANKPETLAHVVDPIPFMIFEVMLIYHYVLIIIKINNSIK